MTTPAAAPTPDPAEEERKKRELEAALKRIYELRNKEEEIQIERFRKSNTVGPRFDRVLKAFAFDVKLLANRDDTSTESKQALEAMQESLERVTAVNLSTENVDSIRKEIEATRAIVQNDSQLNDFSRQQILQELDAIQEQTNKQFTRFGIFMSKVTSGVSGFIRNNTNIGGLASTLSGGHATAARIGGFIDGAIKNMGEKKKKEEQISKVQELYYRQLRQRQQEQLGSGMFNPNGRITRISRGAGRNARAGAAAPSVTPTPAAPAAAPFVGPPNPYDPSFMDPRPQAAAPKAKGGKARQLPPDPQELKNQEQIRDDVRDIKDLLLGFMEGVRDVLADREFDNDRQRRGGGIVSRVIGGAKNVKDKAAKGLGAMGDFLSNLFGNLLGNSQFLSKILGMFTGLFGGMFKMIGKVIGVGARFLGPLAAIAGAAYAGWKIGEWINDKFGDEIGQAVDAVAGFVGKIIDFFKWDNIKEMAESAKNTISGWFDKFKEFFDLDNITKMLGQVVDSVVGVAKGLGGSLLGMVKGVFKGIWNSLPESIQKFAKKFMSGMEWLWEGAKNVTNDAVTTVKSAAATVSDRASSAATTALKGAAAIATDPVKAIGNIISGRAAGEGVDFGGAHGAAGRATTGTGLASQSFGVLSRNQESSGNYGAINTKDNGHSYGAYQLSSKGELGMFLRSSGYAEQFKGLTPESAEFNAKWKALAKSDPGFRAAQDAFIQRRLDDVYIPNAVNAITAATGEDASIVRKRIEGSRALQEMILSSYVQYGIPLSNARWKRAMTGRAFGMSTDADVIGAYFDDKKNSIRQNFKTLISQHGESIVAQQERRIANERAQTLALASATQPALSDTIAMVPTANPSVALTSAMSKADAVDARVAASKPSATPGPIVIPQVSTTNVQAPQNNGGTLALPPQEPSFLAITRGNFVYASN